MDAVPEGIDQDPAASDPTDETGPVTEPWILWDLDTPVEDADGEIFMIQGYTYTFLDVSDVGTEDEAREAWTLAATYVGTGERPLRAVQHAFGDVRSDRQTVNLTLPDLHQVDHELTVHTDTRDRIPVASATIQVYLDDHPPISEDAVLWSPGLTFQRFAVTSEDRTAVWEFGMNASMNQSRNDAEAMYAPYTEGDRSIEERWTYQTLSEFYGMIMHGATIQRGLYQADPVLIDRAETTVELGTTSFQAYNLTLDYPGGGYLSVVVAPALPLPVAMHAQGDDDRPIRKHWELSDLVLTPA